MFFLLFAFCALSNELCALDKNYYKTDFNRKFRDYKSYARNEKLSNLNNTMFKPGGARPLREFGPFPAYYEAVYAYGSTSVFL